MRYGITGGIGSGKTFICNLLQQRGYDIYNCDDEAKRLMVSDKEIISRMKSLIGNDAYNDDGSLNKPVIARFLFSDRSNGEKVNAIVHPVVKKDFLRWAEGKGTALMECAILFESGFESIVDRTILIHAEESTRLKRAMERDNANEDQIRSRMKSQISGAEARKRADYVFDHESYEDTDRELERLIEYINKTE